MVRKYRMKVDEIEIEKGIIIRKPTVSDIEYEYPLGMPFFERTPHPSAILEIKKAYKTPACYLSRFRKNHNYITTL
mgnify:CR=1 FL=1